jgi:hypothetical protein
MQKEIRTRAYIEENNYSWKITHGSIGQSALK